MARSRADALNTYDQLLHPFDGWTFGAYAHEAGQFGLGESKGAVNMVAGGIVDVSPELTLADGQLGGRLSHPLASVGESQQDGEATFPWVVAAASGVEALAAAPEAAEAAAGLSRLRGGNCFVAGTPVQMADGTTKPIDQIKVGDLVKSRNPKTGQTEAKRVDRAYVRVAPQVMTLTFTEGATHQAEAFTCTPEHPFLVDGRGFVKAEDLGIGTSLVTRAGPALTLSAVARGAAPALGGVALGGQAHPAGIRVYNLRVEDDHSYFVGTLHGGTCVHNADYPIPDISKLKDASKALSQGKSVRVGTQEEAEQLLREQYYQHGYANAQGRGVKESEEMFVESQGRGYYHRADEVVSDIETRVVHVAGHKPSDPHGMFRHVQIRPLTGNKVRIFYGKSVR